MLQNKKLSYMDKVTDETLDIWFPTMKDKNKVKKSKNLPLGKSIYDEDEDDDDDYFGIKHTHKVKSELDALTDDKYNKSLSSKNEDKQPERKSKKDRTPEEDEEILDLMYPSMKNIKNKKSDENEKLTGDKKVENKNTDSEKYEIINNVKYPKNTDNELVKKIKEHGKNENAHIELEKKNANDRYVRGAIVELASAAILGSSVLKGVKITKALTPKVGRKVAEKITEGGIKGATTGAVYGLGEGITDKKNLVSSSTKGAVEGAVSGTLFGGATSKIERNFRSQELKNYKPISEMTKEERKEFRKIAQNFYDDYNKGIVIEKDKVGKILFNSTGRDETISKNLEGTKDFPNLVKNIKNSKKVNIEDLNKVRKDHYSNFYVIEGKDKIYKIAVDENGNRYYITKNKNNK